MSGNTKRKFDFTLFEAKTRVMMKKEEEFDNYGEKTVTILTINLVPFLANGQEKSILD